MLDEGIPRIASLWKRGKSVVVNVMCLATVVTIPDWSWNAVDSATSKDVLKETQENLDKTKQSLEIASQTSVNSKEASSYASGGDAYPSVFPYAVTREDGTRQVGFSLQKQGKYPLYGLRVIVGKPYKVSASDPTIQTFGASRQFQELDGNASYAIWFQPIPEENSTFYSAIMSARNGNWEEVINVQKVSSGIASRWVLFRSNDPRVSPNKQVFDLADEKFPPSERKRKIYPLNELALPIADPTKNSVGRLSAK